MPSRKPRWHPSAMAVPLPSGATRWFPLMPDNIGPIFWTFVVVGRLSGAQMCRRRHHGRQPARLEGLRTAGSPPLSGFIGGSQTCSSKLQQQARDLALLNAPIRGWPGTNGAQRGPLRHFPSNGLGFESLGSAPVSVSRVSIGPVESPPVSVLVSFVTVQ